MLLWLAKIVKQQGAILEDVSRDYFLDPLVAKQMASLGYNTNQVRRYCKWCQKFLRLEGGKLNGKEQHEVDDRAMKRHLWDCKGKGRRELLDIPKDYFVAAGE